MPYKDPEARRAYARAYYSTPEWKERQASYTRAYRERNPDKISAANKRRWAEKRGEEQLRNKEKHAYRKNAVGVFTREDVTSHRERQAGLCFYCFQPLLDGFHVDHFIPLSKGGTNTTDNIVCTCPSCNLKKSASMPAAFFARVERERSRAFDW